MKLFERRYYKQPLTRRKVAYHRVGALIESESGREFLLEITDDRDHNHPQVDIIGGSHTSEDLSPRDILRRTLQEQFLEGFGKVVLEKAQPYKDFHIELPQSNASYIYSIFRVPFPQDNFEQARSSICCNEVIKREGALKICSLADLLSQDSLTRGATVLIIGEYTATSLPNPDNCNITYVGVPRNYLEQYNFDFEYQRPVRISTG